MRILLLMLMAALSLQVQAQRTCGAHDHHEELMANDPDYARRHRELEAYTEAFVRNYNPALSRTGEVIIPVVFHIIWNTAAQNISDLRIREQMETFNQDYTATNPDTSLVPAAFKPLIGAFNVRFVLANRDPQGNPTTGIVRRQTTRTSFTASSTTTPTAQPMKFTAQGGSDAWDTRYYLNVWVCNLSGGVLGYATFPASAGTAYDGIVLGSQYTGSTGASAPFNKGRTGTHEVGHYFNLRHIWGDANNCTASDFVDDTPNQRAASSGCPSFPRTDACTGASPGIMFMNYMDYTNDACMYMFTKGQVARMEAALNGPRATLLTSRGYVEEIDLRADSILGPKVAECGTSFTPTLRVRNAGANDITTFTASYRIDSGAIINKQWVGTLAPNATTTVEFDEIISPQGEFRITFFTSNPNGLSDAIPANDTLRRNFSVVSANAAISGNAEICAGTTTTLSASICGDLAFSIQSFANTTYRIDEYELDGTPYAENPINSPISIDGSRANTLRVENFGDWEGLPTFLTFNPNPATPTVTVVETLSGYTQSGVQLFWTGNGNYDICTKSFTVVYGFRNPNTGNVLLPAIKTFRNVNVIQPLRFAWSTGDTTASINVTPSSSTTYSLTVTTASGCTYSSNKEVKVNPLVEPTFAVIPPLCEEEPAPFLPSTSNNGIPGFWSPAIISNTSSGSYTFTPETGQCATPVTIAVTVTPKVTPEFNPISPFCEGSTPPVLETTSNNGVSGSWTPATVSNTSSGVYEFTPNTGVCANNATLNITITPKETPVFNAIAPFCAGATAPTLPSTSNNGIAGTWSPAAISNTSSGTYTFTPEAGACANPRSIDVTVKPIPDAPTAGSNSPVTVGGSINLTATSTPGATYSWTGPNGFSSNQQNPIINNATTANGGSYTVTAILDGCESAPVTINVVVNPASSVRRNEIFGLMLAPNPFRYSTTVSFDLMENKQVVLSITDISGRMMEQRIVNASQGRNILEVGRDLASGTYLLSIDTGADLQTLKMVVVQ